MGGEEAQAKMPGRAGFRFNHRPEKGKLETGGETESNWTAVDNLRGQRPIYPTT